MKLTYVGPHDMVEVPLSHGRVLVARGQSADFGDAVAESLLAQGDAHWKSEGKPAEPKGGKKNDGKNADGNDEMNDAMKEEVV